MSTVTKRRLAACGLAVAALLVPSLPATAATAAEGAAVADVGRLVLEPTARGYEGTLPITVTNDSTQPVSHVFVTEPVAGSWRGTLADDFCMVRVPKEYVRTFDCLLNIAPGESYTLTPRFEVLTRPRAYPMRTGGGQVAVQVGRDTPVTTVTPFRTLFRSTEGELRGARPYRQDRTAQVSLAAGEARLTRQPDGHWAGWVPMTVGYGGDAPNNYLHVAADLPLGMDIPRTDPGDLPSWAGGFIMPGGPLAQGEERTVRVLLTAPADSAPGTLGTATFRAEVYYEGGPVEDRDPADNLVSLPIVLAD